jgi:hypothetical protein
MIRFMQGIPYRYLCIGNDFWVDQKVAWVRDLTEFSYWIRSKPGESPQTMTAFTIHCVDFAVGVCSRYPMILSHSPIEK